MNRKITALDIEIAVAKLFNWRQNLIVPNVSWGFNLRHEADMIIASSAGYVTEIEIKVTESDIQADHKKRWQFGRYTDDGLLQFERSGYEAHMEGPIRRLFFAVPESLARSKHIYPEAGIIAVIDKGEYFTAKKIREAQVRKSAKLLSDKDRLKLAELGCMRIWSLKEHRRNK